MKIDRFRGNCEKFKRKKFQRRYTHFFCFVTDCRIRNVASALVTLEDLYDFRKFFCEQIESFFCTCWSLHVSIR